MENLSRQRAPHGVVNSDEALLATLGYKQEFKRAFHPIEVFGLTFSIFGLFPSIASVLIYAMPNGGPLSMVWGWAICSVFILFVGVAMAELGSAAPTSGGLYYWTYALSSPKWRNVLCWIVGYANTIGNIAGVASIDWGCAIQIMAAVSIGSPGGSFTPTTAQNFAVYALIVLSHAVLCCLGTGLLARLQTVYVVLNVLLCVAVIIALPAATPNGLKNDAAFAFGNFTNMDGWSDGYAFFLSWIAPAWSIGAFDCAVHISEEATNAATAVPWAIMGAISVAGVLGWGINVAMTFSMGQDLADIVNNPIGQPVATIFNNSFGQVGTLILWAVVITVQYMMGSSMLLATSRQVFAFSRDGALPLSKWLYRMNKYTGTPVNTVWYAALISIALGLLAFAGSAAISAVFSLSIVGLYAAYSIPIGARFVFTNNFKPGSFNLGRFSLPVAVVALFYMQFMSIVFLFPTFPQTDAPDMNYTVVLMGGVLLLSLIWFYFPKYGGHIWFKGPVPNIETANEDSASVSLEAVDSHAKEKAQEDVGFET